MKILLVEDDRKTAAYLRRGLQENGFVVDHAAEGEGGLHLATSTDYDLVVLDVMLPGRDGWSVVEGLDVPEFSRARIDASVEELKAERDSVAELGLL